MSKVAFHAAEEHPDGAALLGPLQLLHRFLDATQRRDCHPVDAVMTLRAGLPHETVIGAAQRHVELGVVGEVDQKQSRINHLSGDAATIHIGEPGRNVGQLSARDLDVFSVRLDLRRRRGDETEAAFADRLGKNVAVDQPGRIPAAV